MSGQVKRAGGRAWRAALAAVMLASLIAVPLPASAGVQAQVTPGTIDGTVTDVDGMGIRYVEVYVYEPDGGGGWMPVYDAEWNQVFAMTDDSGYYTLELLPGTYRLKFQDWGDWEYRLDVMFEREFYNGDADISVANDVYVTAGMTTTCDAVLDFEEYGTAAGFITDSSTGVGTYDVGANFYRWDGVDMWEWVQGGGSMSLGDWTCDTLPSGDYKLQFVDDYGRYVSQWYSADGAGTDFDSSPMVSIAPNYVTSGLDAAMDRTSEIRGNVTGLQGGATWYNAPDVFPICLAYDADSGMWQEVNDTGYQQPTDASGNYVIEGLEPGAYRILFMPQYPSSAYWNRFYGAKVYGSGSAALWSDVTPMTDTAGTYAAWLGAGTDIVLGSNESTTGKNAQLPYGGIIEGVVYQPGGALRMEGYRVTLYDDTGLIPIAEDFTNENGEYSFHVLDPAEDPYKVRFDDQSDVNPPGTGPGYFYLTKWWNISGTNADTAAGATGITFGPGSGAGGINNTLIATTNWGTVSGTVRDLSAVGTGTALADMYVKLETYDGFSWNEQYSTWTDALGRYSFTPVPANTYRVSVEQPEDFNLGVGVAYENTSTASFAVSGAGSYTKNLNMVMRSDVYYDYTRLIGGIKGTVGVEGSNSALVAGAPVAFYLYDAGDEVWYYQGMTTTNAYGQYVTGVDVGLYHVQFGPTVQYADEYSIDTTDFAAAATITVGAWPAAVYASVNESLTPAFTISGHAYYGSHLGLEGVEVRALEYDADWDTWGPVTMNGDAAVGYTDSSGAYTIGGLNPGTYRVSFNKVSEEDAYPPDWSTRYWRSTGDAQSVDQADDIVVGPSATNKDATLTAGSYLRGSVTDQDGKRVGQVHVKLWQKSGSQWNQINSTYTYGQGDFQFASFGPGEYYLEFDDDLNFLYGYQWYRSGATSGTATGITLTDGEARVVTATLQAVDTTYSAIFGLSRYETAVNAANEAFPEGASTVVIATGQDWPDALGGSALAGAYDGPMLLVKKDIVPPSVMTCIEDLGATRAIIIGGTGVVGPAVESQLNGLLGASHVDRIFGSNRYQTANLVAEATIDRLGGAYDGKAFVSTGGNFADALAASPLSASACWPIFLANPVTGMDSATVTLMSTLGVNDVIILGGTGAVAPSVETALNAEFGDANVDRLFGDTRYETAAVIAEYGVDNVYGLGWNNVAFATGTNFPDALAGGVLQGMTGSVMLLTSNASVDPAVEALLTANKGTIAEVRFLGGDGAVIPAIRSMIYALLN